MSCDLLPVSGRRWRSSGNIIYAKWQWFHFHFTKSGTTTNTESPSAALDYNSYLSCLTQFHMITISLFAHRKQLIKLLLKEQWHNGPSHAKIISMRARGKINRNKCLQCWDKWCFCVHCCAQFLVSIDVVRQEWSLNYYLVQWQWRTWMDSDDSYGEMISDNAARRIELGFPNKRSSRPPIFTRYFLPCNLWLTRIFFAFLLNTYFIALYVI